MLRRNISTLAIVIAAVFTGLLYLVFSSFKSSTGPFPMNWAVSLPQSDTAFGGIFYNPYISDNIPHSQYKRIEDSVKRIKDSIRVNNESHGTGRGFGPLNVVEIQKQWSRLSWAEREKDPVIKGLNDSLKFIAAKTVGLQEGDSLSKLNRLTRDLRWRYNVRTNELNQQRLQQAEKLYYLGLNGYSLKEDDTRFFMDGDTYNLAYVVWDGVRKGTFDSTQYGHYERKRIPVRYAAGDKRVLIPLTKQQHRFASVALEWGTYGMAFLFVYFFIGLPVQIVVSISKGKAFSPKNIQRFRLMAATLAVYALLATTAPYLLRLVFRDMIPDDFSLTPFSHSLFNNLYLFLIALGLLIISRAFGRGYKLQQENALTI